MKSQAEIEKELESARTYCKALEEIAKRDTRGNIHEKIRLISMKIITLAWVLGDEE